LKARGYTDLALNRLPRLVTAIGVICVIVGVCWGFVEESDIPVRFFNNYWYTFIGIHPGLFLITLVIGILLSSAGTVAWTQLLSRRKRLGVAGCIFAGGLAVFIAVPNNVHGPGMLLGFAAICSWILSLVLAVMAVVSEKRPAK
jgi:hypothetical protein